MTRLRAAVDLLTWPLVGIVAAIVRGPLLRYVRNDHAEHEPEIVV